MQGQYSFLTDDPLLWSPHPDFFFLLGSIKQNKCVTWLSHVTGTEMSWYENWYEVRVTFKWLWHANPPLTTDQGKWVSYLQETQMIRVLRIVKEKGQESLPKFGNQRWCVFTHKNLIWELTTALAVGHVAKLSVKTEVSQTTPLHTRNFWKHSGTFQDKNIRSFQGSRWGKGSSVSF